LKDGEVLVCHHFLSLDPYMRGRMNESKSYAVPQPLGDVMIGGTVGEVVDSRHPKFKAGDQVVGMGGWQEFSVVDATVLGALRKVDTTHVPLSHYLGAVGMPGVTAWYGLVKIIAPKAGETVTLAGLIALQGTDPTDARLRELLSRPIPDPTEHAEALALLRAHSALGEARQQARDWADKARARLHELPANSARDALELLCDYVVDRTG
jgi:hypothetical protein